MYTRAIYDRQSWQLDSHGNGAAYTLTDHFSHTSVFIQGDDATEFRKEFDAAFDQGDRAVSDFFCGYSEVMS